MTIGLNKKSTNYLPWIIWSSGGLFYFYQFILRNSTSYMAEELMLSFQVHGLALGVLGAFYYYAYAPMQIPLGAILDRFGPRRVLIVSCSMCVLGSSVFAFSPNLTLACLGRFLMGMGSAGAWIGSLKLATLWFPPERVGTIIGATMFLGTMGPFFGGPLLSDLVNYIGWRQAMYSLSGIGALLVVFMFKVIQNPSFDAQIKLSSPLLEKELFNYKNLLTVIFSKRLWINAVFAMLMYVPIAAFADLWGVSFIQKVYHIDKSWAATVISSVFLGMGTGALIISYLSDQMNSRRIPMFIGAGGSLIVYIIIIHVSSIPLFMMYGLMFLSGFFFSSQLMCFASAVEMVPTSLSGVVIGFTNMIVMLSGVIFEPFVGWLLDVSYTMHENISNDYTIQDWKGALSSIIVCLALSLILTFFVEETHPHANKLKKIEKYPKNT